MKLRQFLTNMINRYQRFMYGRYGNDELNFVLILFGLLLSLISNFDKLWYLYFLSAVPVTVALLRALSRNTNARYNERLRFIAVISVFKNKYIKIRSRYRDRQTHKFFICKKCKATLRLPKGRGKIKITCPKCGNTMIKKT